MNDISKALRILILEDQPADAELVTRELSKAGFEFVAKNVTSEKEFLAELRNAAPELILADYSLPGYDGLSALTAAQEQCPETPFIFVSGTLGEEQAIETLRHGATDYVLKDRLARLGFAVRRALQDREEVRKREQAEKERHEAETRYRALFEQSRESEEQLRAMFDLASIGVASADPQTGQWLSVNQKLCAITGYSAAEMLRLRVPEITHPDDRQEDWEAFQRVVRGEASDYHLEKRYVRKDGTVVWVNVNMTIIRDAAGQPMRTVATIEDITERMRTKLRIVAFASLGQRLNSAETAREAAEIIVEVADQLLGWDACVFDLYSAAENRMSHLLSMDLINGRRAECKPLRLHQPPTEPLRRTIEQGGQLILRDRPGAVRPEDVPFGDTSRPSASLMFVPIRHGAEVVGILSIQSYTPQAYDAYSLETLQALADYGGGALERLRAQEALSESEANFRSVWERSIDGMRLTDKEGRILAVNEAFCQLVKLPREKLEGQVFSVAYKGHCPTDGIEVYQKRFATGNIVPRLTARAQLWNGEEADLEISNSFIELGQRGKMVLSIFRDVSERKRVELRVDAFSKLGHRLSAAKTAREAAGIITEVAGELLGWDACSFSLRSPSRDLLYHVLNVDTIAGRRVESSPGYGLLSALARRAIELGGQVILKEKPDQMVPGGQPFGDSARPSASILYVPVRKGAEVIAVMSIQSYTPGAYDARSLETLQALADHCAGALDRLRMEEALERERHTAQRYLDIAGVMIVAIDPSQSVLLANRKTCEILGCEERDLIGHDWFEFAIPEAGRNRLKAKFGDIIAGKIAPWEYVEGPVLTRRGEERLIAWHNTLVRDETGRVTATLSSGEDITERKRAEAELQRNHEQYRRAIIAANAIPYQKVFGADTYAFMGEGIKELTGYAPDELRSSVWKEMILETVFLGEAAGLPLAEAARRTLAGEIKHWRADHRIRTRSGAIRWISDCSVQLLDADGKFSGSMGIIQDITQRKELETQLRQAQKMEAVGQLAGGVAHDFNNMLAVIRGNAELLLMDGQQYPAGAREGLKQVVAASERAANLTRQLLAFSRKQVLQSQPLALNEVIANLTKMLKRVLSENIDLQCHYTTPLPYVQADTGMIEQVILNLVVNARDAMPEGGQLRVATEQVTLDEAHARMNPEARAGEFVCLTVSDTGTGIPPEVLLRIFEPFFTTKETANGTGLGLATVHGIVKQHEGWIEVSSQVGQGSTFKVFLPAIPTPARLAPAAAAGGEILGGKETILLVEDEHSVRLTTRRVLESKGYTVREATTAREALEVWQGHAQEIALLLTDIVMPGEMTGRDLAERLWEQRPGLKVVFLSGYSADVLGKGPDFIRRTHSRFLQKPSTSRVILETVRQCLDEKPLGAAPGEARRAK